MHGFRSCSVVALGFLASVFIVGGGVKTANAASLVAKVDLSSQRMHVFIDGKKKYSWPVSTGRRGWRTPTGRFTPIASYRNYYSKRFRMNLPYSVVIASSGIAIHGTSAVGKLGRPASHGCIRLATGNAAKFYSLVGKYGKWGTSVTVQQ